MRGTVDRADGEVRAHDASDPFIVFSPVPTILLQQPREPEAIVTRTLLLNLTNIPSVCESVATKLRTSRYILMRQGSPHLFPHRFSFCKSFRTCLHVPAVRAQARGPKEHSLII